MKNLNYEWWKACFRKTRENINHSTFVGCFNSQVCSSHWLVRGLINRYGLSFPVTFANVASSFKLFPFSLPRFYLSPQKELKCDVWTILMPVSLGWKTENTRSETTLRNIVGAVNSIRTLVKSYGSFILLREEPVQSERIYVRGWIDLYKVIQEETAIPDERRVRTNKKIPMNIDSSLLGALRRLLSGKWISQQFSQIKQQRKNNRTLRFNKDSSIDISTVLIGSLFVSRRSNEKNYFYHNFII